MKLGIKVNIKDLDVGIKGWSIYLDSQYNSYIVVKTSFFGLIKKQVARFQNTFAAKKFINFMSNPLYAYSTFGCTDFTRKLLQDDLKTIADNMLTLSETRP